LKINVTPLSFTVGVGTALALAETVPLAAVPVVLGELLQAVATTVRIATLQINTKRLIGEAPSVKYLAQVAKGKAAL
jgi:hypothetical protein